ncbi:unnamed protein product [Prorocentrum cordatum]|uniref:C3H1-type domain-containing protein n=1 Tax=Prorocentrum cordatum TaxID=2364126 RepID=A0ABN9SL33_9DINO|nr:unnamed protein product [Polarella glacialis]
MPPLGTPTVGGHELKTPPPREFGSECGLADEDDRGELDHGSRASVVSSLRDSSATLTDDSAGLPTRTIIGRSAMPEKIALSTIVQCPRGDDGTALSLGAGLHALGECTPCKFTRSRRGCKDGVLCRLCHASHDEMSRSGIRRRARRNGLQKRALFEHPGEQGQFPDILVKNTFVHVSQASEPHLAGLTRSRSSEDLHAVAA